MITTCERLALANPFLEQPAAERFASLWEEPDEGSALQAALADRYTLHGETGRGGMAIVYRARDLRHQRPVALKVLRATLGGRALSRFRREIALAANLQHPHILPVFDSGEGAGRLWYTMPFVDGESLGARLRRDRRLEMPEAVRMLREIADALAHAHAHGVVHRDLKPDNVLLSGSHAVIADFGVAKAIDAGNDDRLEPGSADALGGHDWTDLRDSATAFGLSVGTPAYMAPEQAAADSGVDHRADLYALGVIAYQLLAGVTPFTGASREELLAAHLSERPATVSTHRHDVSPQLERLVMRLLEKRAADRPPSAADVLAELDTLDVSAREARLPLDAVPLASKRASWLRPRWLLAAAALAIAAGSTAWLARAERPIPIARRVLVVPFENASGDTSVAYLARVAAEWIAQGLARSGYVEVASEIVAPASRTATDIAAVATKTQASLVVSGSYFVIGDSIRAQLRVNDVATGTLLPGASPVSAVRTAPLALLEPLGNQASVMLAPRLDPRIAEWSMGALPGNMEAYRAFIEGLDQMTQGNGSAALVQWNRAAALDSTYVQPVLHSAAALVGMRDFAAAESLVTAVERRRTSLTTGDRAWLDFDRAHIDGNVPVVLETARALVKAEPGAQLPYWFLGSAAVRSNRPQQAIEAAAHVNPQSGRFRLSWAAEIYFLMVTEAYHQLEEHGKELDQARIARTLHPQNRDVLAIELRALAALGRPAEMEPLLSRLEGMPPAPNGPSVPALLTMIAAELKHHDHPADADRVLRRAVDWQRARSPKERQAAAARYDLARALFFLGRFDEAEPVFDSLAREEPGNPSYLAYRGATAARRGQSSVAEQMVAQLSAFRRPYDHGQTSYALAQLAAQRGDTTSAFLYLERSLDQGMPTEDMSNQPGHSIHTDLMLSPLWGMARFRELFRPTG